MNKNISDYLFKYAEHPDPQYAVMLKGKWGCGKSYFVNKWLKEYRKKCEEGLLVIDPIYISLYGLSSTEQITKRIDQVLHPILYSKGAELTKKLFKIAGKIVFKTHLDWNKDDNEDMSFNASLDSLSILASKNSDTVGSKFLVFDDLERCSVDMRLLLGYINNFVEHGACHVIIVGDDTHTTKDAKETLIEFKEKTVGREFEVKPDMDSAVSFFLTEDLPMVDWLKEQHDFIIRTFICTECNNLRLLRQCLYDFNTLYLELEGEIQERNNAFLKNLLASYIVVYCEYRGEYHDLLKDWDWEYMNGIAGNEETKKRISRLQSKYRQLSDSIQAEILNFSHIKHIVLEIETGCSLGKYVYNCLYHSNRYVTRQDKLADFLNMQVDEFERECLTLQDDIICNRIDSFYQFGRSLSLLAFFDKEHMFWFTEAAIALAKRHLISIYDGIKDKDVLFKKRNELRQGMASFMNFYESPIGKYFCVFVNECFVKREASLPNRMEMEISRLCDSNIAKLIALDSEAVPDGHCLYNMSSIFENIDATILAERIIALSNSGLKQMCQFLSVHYSFGCIYSEGCKHFIKDETTLVTTRKLLNEEFATRKGIDRYMANFFMKYFDGAIRRSQGEGGSIMN